jgi:hypothetical protein
MITNVIGCDKCGIIGFSSTGKKRFRIHTMRALLRVNGWLVGVRGGKDYCPICRVIRLEKPITITPDFWHSHLRKNGTLEDLARREMNDHQESEESHD